MIYFDHSATTPIDKEVLKTMLPYMKDNFGNPSSIHSFGANALLGVDEARGRVASFLNCERDEVIFTSGATESNNLTLKGVVTAAKKEGINNPHVITTQIEHDSVLEPLASLKEEGVLVTYLPVDSKGVVLVEEIKKFITDNTVLVSVMYVNSETGSKQPILEIGKIIKSINNKKQREWQQKGAKLKEKKPRDIYFHTDATQAVNFFDCDTKKFNLDLLSLSGHKIYGPKGVGVLYVKKGVKIKGIQLGGHQERNLRSGTLNVPGIVGLGKAVSLINSKSQEINNKKILDLRNFLLEEINKNISDVILNTDLENSTPAHAHFSFLGCEGESVLISLDMEGVAVSTGSACASTSLKSSHVLLAMGVKEEDTNYAIRFSLGKNNTKEEIKKLVKILPGIVKKFRDMNPLYKNK